MSTTVETLRRKLEDQDRIAGAVLAGQTTPQSESSDQTTPGDADPSIVDFTPEELAGMRRAGRPFLFGDER